MSRPRALHLHHQHGYETEILVASVRHGIHVLEAAKIGADVMTAPPAVIKALRPYTKAVFDCHLMISPADPFLEAFADAGCDVITVHAEAGPHLHRSLQKIRSLDIRAIAQGVMQQLFHALEMRYAFTLGTPETGN